MFLRKERIPQVGLSNLDYKAKDTLTENKDFKPTKTSIDFLSIPRKKNFIDLLKQKMAKPVPVPLEDTKKFYEETGKKPMEKTEISHKRSSQLEEKEKRKRVFTGDSNVIFNENLYQGNRVVADYEQIKKLLPGLAKEKHEMHAKAIQETQLIGMEAYNKETLEGLVNLEKVKEIRRAIRRRYANRKNFKNIFTAWDEDSQGVLSVKNVYNMVQRLGLNINTYEAQVLVASADRNGNGCLSLDEFLDLIFNDNTMLNVDLKKIPLKENDEFDKAKSDQVLKVLTEDARESRVKKHKNQVELILQNQINPIINYCIDLDQKKEGILNKEKYKKLLEKINISDHILTNEDRENLFNEFKNEQNNFNYKTFIDKIRNFTYKPDEAYNEPEKNARSMPEKSKMKQRFLEYENTFNDNHDKTLRIMDIKTMPINQLENIRVRFKKVFRVLNTCFNKKEDLDDFIKKEFHLDNDEFSQTTLSQKNLGKVFNGFLSAFERVSKKDVESFLSVFNYNEYGYTKANTISNLIYDEDDTDFYMRANNRLKGPEPPEFKTKVGNFVEESEKAIEKNSKILMRSQSAQPYSKVPLTQILEKIDSNVFLGRTRAYDAFKLFDKDKDGFVTKEDLFKRFQELNILNRNEFETFMDYLDPAKKGCLTFSEFSQKVKPNMGKTDENGNFLVPPNVLPSKTMTDNFLKNLDSVKAKYNQIYLPYRPESHALMRNTRNGNRPAWKDTFQNFQAPTDSAMHVTEQERFQPDKVKFLKDENIKKTNYENARLGKIKNYQDQIFNKIQTENDRNYDHEQFMLKKKGETKWAYEHVIVIIIFNLNVVDSDAG